ncbi:hypothetical protein FNV43_RR10819 [Rhamnella rubrinervis]|uniref:Malic enzyme N-terminal domain-containing protein n=1 Tax=Rhamnella rubrinervis TaxID=2594499 RepID=A0A8K0MHA1_9ROSA|nr:hypothetical protein FNV43_RR10819 [Rhamnella rubrinervis]
MANMYSRIRASSSIIKRFNHRATTTGILCYGSPDTSKIIHYHRGSPTHHRPQAQPRHPPRSLGTAFSMTERDRLDLRGLLPPNVMSSEQQIERFSKVLIANIEEYAPIVYTPTVGLVCQNYSGLFRRPRGMYFSAEDRGEMMSMVYNWPAEQVDMIVVTDGSRILGLGELGVQGIGIAIGKLDLYVAAAGINPECFKLSLNCSLFSHLLLHAQYVLSVMIDVGNNYEKLLKDPLRTTDVVIAGLLGAVTAQGKPMIDFLEQKIVVGGAGSLFLVEKLVYLLDASRGFFVMLHDVGIRVFDTAIKTMAMMIGNNGNAFESAGSFWVFEKPVLETNNANGRSEDGHQVVAPINRVFLVFRMSLFAFNFFPSQAVHM